MGAAETMAGSAATEAGASASAGSLFCAGAGTGSSRIGVEPTGISEPRNVTFSLTLAGAGAAAAWAWIPIVIWAAFAQTIRNATQRTLVAGGSRFDRPELGSDPVSSDLSSTITTVPLNS